MRERNRRARYAPTPDSSADAAERPRARERILASFSPAIVAATATVALLGSAAIAPSFASSRPAAQAAGSAARDQPGGGDRQADLARLVTERRLGLERASAEIESSGRAALLDAHHLRARRGSSAVRAEIKRLRNLSTFLWPTEGGVSSPFGWRVHPILGYRKFHNGADIGGACNNPIYAAQSGTVVRTGTGYSGGAGNNVRIDHGDIDGRNIQTAYLHMTRFVVRSGQDVKKGELIGFVGSTGLSTACHLHLSLYKDGAGSDPLEYVKK